MTNPRWLEPLPDAQLMRATDGWAIDTKGVPARQLMERAGEGLARAVGKHAPAGRIAVICGKGNNGGDGLVAARLLRQAGREVDVLAVWPPEWMGEDAQAQVKVLPGPAPVPFHPDRLEKAHAIVDAVLGTGFEGAPRDPADAVILAINAARARVIAADVPSGVNASTGEVEGSAVRAVATATFHQAKPGLWIHPGKAHAGVVEVVDIGIPAGAPGEAEIGLIGGGVLFDMPRRTADSTKFSSGNVFIIGGSHGLTGAPSMAALAAMRAGAGYVTVGAPQSLELSFTVRLLEAMMVGLPERDGSLTPTALQPALEAIGRADAVVLGPGIGKNEGAQELARELVERIDVPLVVDADGLNALAGGSLEELVRVRPWPTVMTPHAGELGRMLDVDSKEIGAPPPPLRPRGGGQGEGDHRAQGRRHARGDAQRPGRGVARLRARARHRRHRRRALRRDRRDAGQGPRARPRRRRRRLRAPARGADRRRARRSRRGHRLRRDPRAARRPGKLMPPRRRPGWTWARSSATRRGLPRWPPRRRCARSSRPTATATGWSRPPARRRPAARAGSRSRPPRRRAGCARRGSRARCW